MKHVAATLALLVVLAGAAAAVSYRLAGDGEVKTAITRGDSMEWLRAEFSLTPDQFARIAALHASYAAVCDEHCRAIQEAMRERSALQNDPATPPAALGSAEASLNTLLRECERAIEAHVRACAALMSPADGERYLALVLPKINDYDHLNAPGLHVSGHAH